MTAPQFYRRYVYHGQNLVHTTVAHWPYSVEQMMRNNHDVADAVQSGNKAAIAYCVYRFLESTKGLTSLYSTSDSQCYKIFGGVLSYMHPLKITLECLRQIPLSTELRGLAKVKLGEHLVYGQPHHLCYGAITPTEAYEQLILVGANYAQ